MLYSIIGQIESEVAAVREAHMRRRLSYIKYRVLQKSTYRRCLAVPSVMVMASVLYSKRPA